MQIAEKMSVRYVTYLDSEGTYSRDHIQVSSKHPVAWEIGIILPNRARTFHSSNFRNVTHHRHVCQVNDVTEASGKVVGGDWRIIKESSRELILASFPRFVISSVVYGFNGFTSGSIVRRVVQCHSVEL
jgi:hypothetical protein